MAKYKAYTVFKGRDKGVFKSWAEVEPLVKGFEGASFKGYETYEAAQHAYLQDDRPQLGGRKSAATNPTAKEPRQRSFGGRTRPNLDTWSVDAACSGNPGPMEYRGVITATGEEIFRVGPIRGTNNIGEFLAIVHALAMQQKAGLKIPIYSDSVNAMSWIKAKNARTKLPLTDDTKSVWQLIDRATTWLHQNSFRVPLLKWDTENWGEIPADFGRK